MTRAGYIPLGQRLVHFFDPLARGLFRFPPLRGLLGFFSHFGFNGRLAVVGIPYLWLTLFFLIPFLVVLKISFSAEWIGHKPPYAPLLEWAEDGGVKLKLTLHSYQTLVNDSLYWKAYLNSIKIAFFSTLFCLLLGFPMAYAIARADKSIRGVLLMLVILPFWTSFLLRVYAWMVILKNPAVSGFVEALSQPFIAIGFLDKPLQTIYSPLAVYIGIVYSYLPFMIMPLYATLEKMDITLLEAAYDLGCRPVKAFFTITVPLALPGIIAGCMLVFIPAVGEYVIPELLGGPNVLMIGRELTEEFLNRRSWPIASAIAIVILAVLVIPIMIFQNAQAKDMKGTARGK